MSERKQNKSEILCQSCMLNQENQYRKVQIYNLSAWSTYSQKAFSLSTETPGKFHGLRFYKTEVLWVSFQVHARVSDGTTCDSPSAISFLRKHFQNFTSRSTEFVLTFIGFCRLGQLVLLQDRCHIFKNVNVVRSSQMLVACNII